MKRTTVSLIELVLVTAALSAAVYVLGDAAYQPGAVKWTPIAAIGTLTALSFTGLAAVLYVGRAALSLAARQFARRPPAAKPPSPARPPGTVTAATRYANAWARVQLWRPRHAGADDTSAVPGPAAAMPPSADQQAEVGVGFGGVRCD